jgi:hypothetical protein
VKTNLFRTIWRSEPADTVGRFRQSGPRRIMTALAGVIAVAAITTPTAASAATQVHHPVGHDRAAPDHQAVTGAPSHRHPAPVQRPRTGLTTTSTTSPGDVRVAGTHNVQFHNRYWSTVSVAVLFYAPNSCGGEGGNWRTTGWYNLAPGETRQLLTMNGGSSVFAFYAKSADGKYVWPGQQQSGLVEVYVHPTAAFDHCLNLGSTSWEVVNMKPVDVGTGSGTFTEHLNPPS